MYVLVVKDVLGDWSASIPSLYIASKWITMRHQPNKKLALAIMPSSAYYKYDILTRVEVGGSDRNVKGRHLQSMQQLVLEHPEASE